MGMQQACLSQMEAVKLNFARDGAVQIDLCNSYFGTPKAPFDRLFNRRLRA